MSLRLMETTHDQQWCMNCNVLVRDSECECVRGQARWVEAQIEVYARVDK